MEPNKYRVNICTSAGKSLDENEDAVFLYSGLLSARENISSSVSAPFLLGICDGMGGEAYGKTAAEIAASEAEHLYEEIKNADNSSEIRKAVISYTNRANRLIVEKLAEKLSQGGTTLAVVFVDKNNTAHCFSLGDSRIYIFSGSGLKQVSTDHTLAMKKYLMNIYSKDEAEKSDDSHKLTLFLGADVNGLGLKPECYPPLELNTDINIMLCSDGVYDMVGAQKLEDILCMCGDGSYADALVAEALRNGGKDNASCITLSYGPNG